MCVDPITATLIAGTALSAGSAAMGGYQQASASRFQAAQAQQNAQLAQAQAAQVQDQGSQDALNQSRKIHATMADQTVGAASEGLDVSMGTPLDIIAGTAQLGQEDLTRLRQNTQDRTASLLIQSNNFNDTAAADKAAASNDVTSGWLKAGGDILSGAAQIAKPSLSASQAGGVATAAIRGSGGNLSLIY